MRTATLGTIINKTIGYESRTEIHCQVSPRPMFSLLYCPVNFDAKAWGTTAIVSTSLYAVWLQHIIFSLVTS